MTASTRRRVSAATSARPLITFETVGTETPARRATSAIVGRCVVGVGCCEEAMVARPVLELAGFRRVTLDPDELRTVTFRLAAEMLVHTGVDRRRIVEPGEVTILIGSSSEDLPLRATIALVGETVEVRDRRRYVTPTSVSSPQRLA